MRTDEIKEIIKEFNLPDQNIDERLFDIAFTHKSYAADFKEPPAHNERLEFLGDSILGAVISDLLYKNFGEEDESTLTLYKISLVREENLATVTKILGIQKYIKLGKGEERSGGREKETILGDLLEAFIGNIYLQFGRITAYQFVQDFVYRQISTMSTHTIKSAKSLVQEHIQKIHKELPKYIEKEMEFDTNGNCTVYQSELFVKEDLVAEGKGPSKKKAQENAAISYREQLQTNQNSIT